MSTQVISSGRLVCPMPTNGSPLCRRRATRSSSSRISIRMTPSTRLPVTTRSNERSCSPPDGESRMSRSARAAASTTLATKPSWTSVRRRLAGGMTRPIVRVLPSLSALAAALGR